MALHSLYCADVPLRNCSHAHCCTQPRYSQLRAIKDQKSRDGRQITPAKCTVKTGSPLPQPSITEAASSSKLLDRHFTDAIVRLSPVDRKVCSFKCSRLNDINDIVISKLPDVTCHVGSHSVTATQFKWRCCAITPASFTYPRGMEGLVYLGNWQSGYIPRWFSRPQTVTIPSTSPSARSQESKSRPVSHKSDTLTTTLPLFTDWLHLLS